MVVVMAVVVVVVVVVPVMGRVAARWWCRQRARPGRGYTTVAI